MTPAKKNLSLIDKRRQQAAEEKEAAAASPAEAVAVPKPKRSIISGPRGPVFETCNFTRTLEADSRFAETLQDASPFLSPLSLTQFIELIYCEVIQNKQLWHMMNDFFETTITVSGVNGKKSSFRLNTKIVQWIIKETGGTTHSAMSMYIEWIFIEWENIKPLLSYRRFS